MGVTMAKEQVDGQSSAEWVETQLDSARRINGVAEKSNGVTQSMNAEAGKKLVMPLRCVPGQQTIFRGDLCRNGHPV